MRIPVTVDRASYRKWRDNDVRSQEREVTMRFTYCHAYLQSKPYFLLNMAAAWLGSIGMHNMTHLLSMSRASMIERRLTHLMGKSDSLRLRKKFHFQCLIVSKSVMHCSSMVSRLAPPQIDENRWVASRMLSNRWPSDVNSLYRYSCRCKRNISVWEVTALWSN